MGGLGRRKGFETSICKRKAERKVKRLQKKSNRHKYFSTPADEKFQQKHEGKQPIVAVEKIDDKRPIKDVNKRKLDLMDAKKDNSIQNGMKNKRQKPSKLEKFVRGDDAEEAETPEDVEIAMLEKKLGVKGKDKKSLERELNKEGLDLEFWDFLDKIGSDKLDDEELEDNNESESESDNFENLSEKGENNGHGEIAESDSELVDNSDESEPDAIDSNEDEVIDNAEKNTYIGQDDYDDEIQGGNNELIKDRKEIVKESDIDAEENTVFIPKEDIYGKNLSNITNKRPNSRLFNNSKDDGKDLLLKRRLNGLLNKITEENLSSTTNELVSIYSSSSRRSISDGLFCSILSSLKLLGSTPVTLVTKALRNKMTSLFAVIISSLGVLIAPEVVSQLLEAIIVQLNQQLFDSEKQGLCECLVSVVSFAFNFGVCSYKLVLSSCQEIISHAESSGILSPSESAIISQIVTISGPILRKTCPAGVKALIESLQILNDDKGVKSSSRTKLLDQLFALKNNRLDKETLSIQDTTKNLAKWLKQVQQKNSKDESTGFSAYDFSFNDLIHAEEKGRWWIVGSSWQGKYGQNHLPTIDESEMVNSMKGTSRGPLYTIISSAGDEILLKARKLKFNTDIRRAIFIVLMSSDDEIMVTSKLMALNLSDVQQREIVHVLFRVCGVSKNYTPYFAAVLSQLCQEKPQFKFTTQLAFWDYFKLLEEDDQMLTDKQLINMANLLADCIFSGSLSLAVLKVVEFDEMGSQARSLDSKNIRFFNSFFYNFILHGYTDSGKSESKTKDVGLKSVMKAFRKIAQTKDFQIICNGIQFFLKNFMLGQFSSIEKTNEFRSRTKKVVRLVDALTLRLEEIQGDEASTSDIENDRSDDFNNAATPADFD